MKDKDKTREQLIEELEALRHREEYFRTLVENSSDVIMTIDSNQNIPYISPSIERVIGYKPEKYIGKNAYEFVHPEDIPGVVNSLTRLVKKIGATQPVELRIQHYDRSWRFFRSLCKSILDEFGSPLILINARDITGRKQADEEIKRLHEDLERRVIERTAQLEAANKKLENEIIEHKQMEVQIRKLSHAITQCPSIVMITDIKGNIEYVNPKFTEITGHTADEIIGTSAFDLGEQSPREYKKMWDTIASGREWHGIFYNKKKCGEFYWEAASISAVRNTEGVITNFIKVAEDVTERKQAEEKYHTAHQQLLDIIDFLPDATFVIDQDKKVIAWNRAIEEMTDVRKEDIIGKGDYAYTVPFYGRPGSNLIDLIFSDDREAELKYEYVERKGNKLFAEAFIPYVFEGKGAFLWSTASPLFNIDGNLVGAIQTIRDITRHKQMEDALRKHRDNLEEMVKARTAELKAAYERLLQEIAERKQVEETLRSSEKRFSIAFNASPSPMTIHTLADWQCISANYSFLHITGFRREDVIGRTLTELNFWADPLDGYAKIRPMILQKGTVHNQEVSFRTKQGEVRAGLFSAEIIDLNGEHCILTVINDITERKQMEKEMAHLDRLHLVGEMAAGIGHEIRNPMTTVRGFLQILKVKKNCIEYNEYYDLMLEELDRANAIITGFLSLAKNRAVEFKEQNLNNILEALFPLIQADAMVFDKYLHVEPGDIPDLPLDEKEIRQLILNLARNGLEAMSPGEKLTIKTFTDGKEAVLAVQNQGKGIEPDVLEKIGTPFFTTKDSGTGLGLAVCYSIAARHNAIIKVETGATGTTFFVRFVL